MNKIQVYKYHAAGNDFVMVNNSKDSISLSTEEIKKICHRRFGLGADGIVFINPHPKYDYEVVYFNADGSIGFCGNGCRASVMLAHRLDIVKKHAIFLAADGVHKADIIDNEHIKVSMSDVKNIEQKSELDYFVNTGTEHNVRFVKNLSAYPVVEEGRKIRYSDAYKPKGTNANFVEVDEDGYVNFRIYERGVEDETYSSGSGATACALTVAEVRGLTEPINLRANGGNLIVNFHKTGNGFVDIYLTGPARFVYKTDWER